MLNQHGGCVPYESIEDDDRTQASQAMNRPFGSVHCLELGTNQALLKPFTLMLGGNLAHAKVPAKPENIVTWQTNQKTAKWLKI